MVAKTSEAGVIIVLVAHLRRSSAWITQPFKLSRHACVQRTDQYFPDVDSLEPAVLGSLLASTTNLYRICDGLRARYQILVTSVYFVPVGRSLGP